MMTESSSFYFTSEKSLKLTSLDFDPFSDLFDKACYDLIYSLFRITSSSNSKIHLPMYSSTFSVSLVFSLII